MNITIDQEGCTECGACVGACADIYEMKTGEKASIVEKYRAGSPAKGEVGEDLSECARSGADVCPVNVIHIK